MIDRLLKKTWKNTRKSLTDTGLVGILLFVQKLPRITSENNLKKFLTCGRPHDKITKSFEKNLLKSLI